jgi:predicted ATPase/class 3 adenylate cyclase
VKRQSHDGEGREARKRVTVVFCDLSGSTTLGERLDAESLRGVIGRYHETMRPVIERHGGSVDFSGDAVIGAFGLDETHEDDALRGVRAAAEMRSGVTGLNDEVSRGWDIHLDVRIGVNTGEVVAGDRSHASMVASDAFNVCARLEHEAATGEILLGEDTERLVRGAVLTEPIEPLRLRGKADAVVAHRLLDVVDALPGVVRDLSAPLVGRRGALDQLVLTLDEVEQSGRSRLVLLVGDPGIGKSRLARELVATITPRAHVVSGRCLPYGDGITFWPLAEIVREAAGVHSDDLPGAVAAKIAALAGPGPNADDIAAGVAAAIGVSEHALDRERIFWAVRTLLRSMAARRPLLVILEDLHWAEPTLIELVNDITRHAEAPIMVLAVGRSELLDSAGLESADVLELGPLTPAEGRRLVANLIGADDLPGDRLEQIVGPAQGNPLFMKELLGVLIDEGALGSATNGGPLDGGAQDVTVPPTLQGLLGARLEALASDERRVLECASVVGEEFWPSAVAHLESRTPVEAVRGCIAALARRGLVQPGGAPFMGEPAFRFTHVLMRDAAYEQLLKEDRARLHERLAGWIERRAGERSGEYGEILGYHLERAARCRLDLSPSDEQGAALARRAAELLRAAAHRALARADEPAAANLLERAASLLPPGDADRHLLLPELRSVLAETGRPERAGEVFREWIDVEQRGEAHAAPGTVTGPAPDAGAPARPSGGRVPLPGAIAAATQRKLFGRDAEVQVLRQALAGARTGSRRGVLVAGDPGIGKTALVAHAAREAYSRGALVLYGRCDEDLPIPYRPFAEALDHLVQHSPGELLARQAHHHGRVLARLVPELAERMDTPQSALGTAEADPYMLFSAAASLLADASREAPVLLVLDDLHWADAPTVPLLRYLLTAGPDMSLAVIATYRDSEVPAGHPLEDLLTDLAREAAVARIELEGLTEEAMIDITQSRAHHRLDAEGVDLARVLHQETGGNPFFAIELLRHLIESRALVRRNDQWSIEQQVRELELPDSVLDAVTRRVRRLVRRHGERAGELLAAASSMGGDIEPRVIGAVLGAGQDEVGDLLDAACKANLLEADALGERYSFPHALVGQAVYEGLGTAAERRRLHRRIAEALEQLYGEDPGPRIVELAHHWLASFEPEVAGKALDYVRRAGDYALAKLAPDEALRLYSAALERHERHREGGERMACELLIGLGSAQRQLGRPQFRETLLDASHMARRLGATDLLVRAAHENTRGFVSETGEVDAERIAVLRAALEALGDGDSAERARLLSRLAAELTFAGDWDQRRALSDEALAIARRLGDPHTLTDVLSVRFMATWTPETLAERYSNTSDELSVVESAGGDRLARFWAVHWRATACIERGDLHEAERRIAEEADIAERIGHPTARWLAAYDRTSQALIRGRLADAERWAAEAYRIGEEGGEPEAATFYGGQLVNIRYEQGRLTELEDAIEAEAQRSTGIPAFWGALALARAEAGNHEGARAAIAVMAPAGFTGLAYDSNWLVGMVLFADACGLVGDTEAAAALERRLAPWAGQVAFNSATAWGSVARHVGVLNRVLGRHDAAVAHLERAADLHERIGAPLWLARTRLDLGQALLGRTRGSDADRARRLLEQALTGAERFGCATVARRSAALLRSGVLSAAALRGDPVPG